MISIAWDSSDKSGKDTLIKEFHKSTNFQYPCINRWTGTSYSYGKFWNRDLNFEEYLKYDFQMFDKIILVYLYAPNEIIEKRFIEHNEKDIDIKDLQKLKDIYEKDYLEKTPLYTIKVDTSQSIKDCIELIKIEIMNFENESPVRKWKRLCKSIKAFGDKISNTKELRNIEMNFNYGQIEDDRLYEYLQENNLWDPHELYEFDEIKHTLINQIRLKLWYFKNQDLDSRQFTYNSNSCISFIQVLKRNKEVEFYFTIRSSNVEKMLLQDIWGMNNIANEVNQRFFNLPYRISLRIISAHIYDDNKTNSELQEL
jgi:hypothetical protein